MIKILHLANKKPLLASAVSSLARRGFETLIRF
jgi:hypothetical protein